MNTPADTFDLDVLEFQAVRAMLIERLTTPLGRTSVERLAPLRDASAARSALQVTREVADRARDDDALPLSGVAEVRSWLEAFFAGEHSLGARDLADLKRLLRCYERCRRWLAERSGMSGLCAWSERLEELSDLVAELEMVVDDRGEVLDTASARLAELRREIDQARAGVDAAVQRVLGHEEVRRSLQTPEPAWRHGRPVLQVKQEHRARVPGVLHDRSQSGATLFVEPDVVVEAANVLSDLRAAEHREVQVVLAHVGRGLQRNRSQVTGAVEGVAAMDMTAAKASLILKDGYAVPEVVEEGALRLREARHPLLLRSKADHGEVVPLDLTLGDPHRLLVVTGPNTGGKTVVLKTVGLLSLMAMAGVPVPAGSDSRIPFFSAVLADIGDEQGISQNLSTFSSHVRRIARCLTQAAPSALILLDELGAGTDPEEGGVLGYAVLEELLQRSTFAVVTTHLGRLKAFAYQQKGADNGSMTFDGRSLRPLYRLEVGIPGQSHALDIAGRVGMPEGVVRRARELLGVRDPRLQDVIDKVTEVRRDAEEQRRRTVDLTRKAEEDSVRLEERLREAERRDAWLQEEADGLVDEQMRALQADLVDPLKHLRNAPGDHGERARALLETVQGLMRRTSVHRRRMAFCSRLKRGQEVFLPRWNRRGKVRKVDKVREKVVVEYGRMTMEVPFEDISWLQPLE